MQGRPLKLSLIQGVGDSPHFASGDRRQSGFRPTFSGWISKVEMNPGWTGNRIISPMFRGPGERRGFELSAEGSRVLEK